MTVRRALFLARPVPVAAAAMRGWLAAGNEIVAIWIGRSPSLHLAHHDARLAYLAPRWSTAAVARRHGIAVHEAPRLANWAERLAAVRATGADVLVSAYFPFVVPRDILDHFGGRAVNFHPSPLPRYRGPTPSIAMMLDRSILTDAAMTLHVLSDGLDAGDIIARLPVKYAPEESFGRYELNLSRAARILSSEALPAYLDGHLTTTPQDESLAHYARVAINDFVLGPQLKGEETKWICNTIGKLRPLHFEGLGDIKIVGFDRDLGPPSGAGTRSGPLTIDVDVADRRVRLFRKRFWSSPLRKAIGLGTYIAERDP